MLLRYSLQSTWAHFPHQRTLEYLHSFCLFSGCQCSGWKGRCKTSQLRVATVSFGAVEINNARDVNTGDPGTYGHLTMLWFFSLRLFWAGMSNLVLISAVDVGSPSCFALYRATICVVNIQCQAHSFSKNECKSNGSKSLGEPKNESRRFRRCQEEWRGEDCLCSLVVLLG